MMQTNRPTEATMQLCGYKYHGETFIVNLGMCDNPGCIPHSTGMIECTIARYDSADGVWKCLNCQHPRKELNEEIQA